jgi:hypothetical protein
MTVHSIASFEDSLAELEFLVDTLEKGELSLEDALETPFNAFKRRAPIPIEQRGITSIASYRASMNADG